MTFGQKRRAVRNLRAVQSLMRERQRGRSAQEMSSLTLTVPAQMFEDAVWALGYVKTWDPEAKQWYRANVRFVSPSTPEPNFMMRGCLVVQES